jgi:hypothetical protein
MKFLFMCIFTLVSVVSFADEGMKNCHKEMKELCKDKKGRDRFACLKENTAKLSPECQQKIEQKKEKWQDRKEDCKADRESLCKDIEPGEGRIRDCMKKNMDKLSPACKEHISKAKQDLTAD